MIAKRRRNTRTARFFTVAMLLTLTAAGCSGCGGGAATGPGGGRQFLSIGTAPVGGAFFPVGDALAQVLTANKDEINWKVTAKATKGTRANIRGIDNGELQFALANSAITYFAVRGEGDWEKKYPVKTVMTLAPNIAMFITLEGSGVNTIADLKGKRVVVGPAGAGFEFFLAPLLEAHGITYDDFSPLNNTQSGAVDMLGDGSAAAAFLGGAVPTASITQACSTHDVVFIPFDEAAKSTVVEKYKFFETKTVKAGVYSDLKVDYAGMNVGSMHLICGADADEELVYQVTKTLYENAEAVVQKHPVGKAINPKVAVRNTGTDFHPGAIRFYEEAGIWPNAKPAAKDAADDVPDEKSQDEPAQ